jgi:hypothetical protein
MDPASSSGILRAVMRLCTLLSRECLVRQLRLIFAENIGTARELFRLFKSFNEWVKIKEFMKQDSLP